MDRTRSEIGFVFEKGGGMVLRGTGELGILARIHSEFGFVFEHGGGMVHSGGKLTHWPQVLALSSN